MISSRENYANLLTSYLGSPMEGLRYSVDQGREATIFMRKLYEDSLF